MNKFEKVYEIQKQYKRGVRSYSDAIRGIKEVFSKSMKTRYRDLKVILSALGVNVTELDTIKE